MVVTLTVFKEVHNTWPDKNGKPGGESFDLLCMDMSSPPEHRMEEMLYYRTKDDERNRIWGKTVGTTIVSHQAGDWMWRGRSGCLNDLGVPVRNHVVGLSLIEISADSEFKLRKCGESLRREIFP